MMAVVNVVAKTTWLETSVPNALLNTMDFLLAMLACVTLTDPWTIPVMTMASALAMIMWKARNAINALVRKRMYGF